MRLLACVNLADEEATTVVGGALRFAERAVIPTIIDVLHVGTIGTPPTWVSDPVALQTLSHRTAEVQQHERDRLQALVSAIPDAHRGVAILAEGRPAEVIGDKARDYSAVVLAGRRRGTLDRLLLGSVASRVARASSVPVIVVPGGGGSIHRDKPRALLGVDLRATDAGAGLDVAAQWAARLGAVLDLVHVDQERLQVPYVLDSDVRQRLDREWEALRDRDIATLNNLLAGIPEIIRGHSRVEEGDPVEILCDLADEYDFVVVATHGRTGLALLMVGSVAEKLIPRCPRPVLVVRSS